MSLALREPCYRLIWDLSVHGTKKVMPKLSPNVN
jgi:hypothetical protein